MKNIIYSAISAIVFMIIFTLWVNPSIITNSYDNLKNFANKATYDVEKDPNIVFIDDKPLKIANPELFTYRRFDGISYTISYQEDENTDFIVAFFTDNSGYLNNKYYRVIYRTNVNDFELCKEHSNKTKGDMYCSISGMKNQTKGGILLGSFYADNGDTFFSVGSDMKINEMIINYWKSKGK
ncbi:MAG: hypothetical protein Q7R52_04280 [archaeon]|nr:hypothetical protein [archaeon]